MLQPNNAVQGRFTKAGQLDWAILCSRNETSTILVFRNSEIHDVAELSPAKDRQYLQGGGGSTIEYSRMITVADASFIRRMNDEFGHVSLPRLDHDGIDDAFEGKASGVHYWNGRRWLALAGAD